MVPVIGSVIAWVCVGRANQCKLLPDTTGTIPWAGLLVTQLPCQRPQLMPETGSTPKSIWMALPIPTVNWLALDTAVPLTEGASKELMAPPGADATVAVSFSAISIEAAPVKECA